MMWWGSAKKTTIKAVDEVDFLNFLRNIGVLDAVIKKEAKCAFCGRFLAPEDIDAIYPKDGEVKFICDKPKCSVAFGERSAETP